MYHPSDLFHKQPYRNRILIFTDSHDQVLSGHMQIKAQLGKKNKKRHLRWNEKKNKTAWKLSKKLAKLNYQMTTYNTFAGLIERDKQSENDSNLTKHTQKIGLVTFLACMYSFLHVFLFVWSDPISGYFMDVPTQFSW